MRKLIVSTFMTLNGVMQAPGGPGENDDRGFTHGGWSVNYWDEQMSQVMGEAMSAPLTSSSGARPTTSSPHTGRTPRKMPAASH